MSSPGSSANTGSNVDVDGDAGIRCEMAAANPSGCPLSDISEACGVTVGSIARSRLSDDRMVIEFTMPSGASPTRSDVTAVFSNGEQTRYRCEYEPPDGCLCEFVEQRDCPVSEQHVVRGTVHVTFYAADVETIRSIVAAARESFGNVRLEHLSQSSALTGEDPVVVDRGCLTDRQREVLSTAHELGYFEYPKQANACDVAAALDIATSTFSEHLAAAQTKLLAAILEEP